jgi:hypothetical protein
MDAGTNKGGAEMTNNEKARAAAEIALAAMESARELAREDEARLGRTLTDAEVGRIVDLVERQLKTALVLVKF